MIIKIKKYVATVSRYVEHDDGTITKTEDEITLKGQRFSEASVWKQIPSDAKLISHGYVEQVFEVDTDALHEFCITNGKPVSKDAENK